MLPSLGVSKWGLGELFFTTETSFISGQARFAVMSHSSARDCARGRQAKDHDHGGGCESAAGRGGQSAFEKRAALAQRLRAERPNCVPVVCKRAALSDLPEITRTKYMLGRERLCEYFNDLIRDAINEVPGAGIPVGQSIYLYAHTTCLLEGDVPMCDLYDRYKDRDGMLYITYSDKAAEHPASSVSQSEPCSLSSPLQSVARSPSATTSATESGSPKRHSRGGQDGKGSLTDVAARVTESAAINERNALLRRRLVGARLNAADLTAANLEKVEASQGSPSPCRGASQGSIASQVARSASRLATSCAEGFLASQGPRTLERSVEARIPAGGTFVSYKRTPCMSAQACSTEEKTTAGVARGAEITSVSGTRVAHDHACIWDSLDAALRAGHHLSPSQLGDLLVLPPLCRSKLLGRCMRSAHEYMQAVYNASSMHLQMWGRELSGRESGPQGAASGAAASGAVPGVIPSAQLGQVHSAAAAGQQFAQSAQQAHVTVGQGQMHAQQQAPGRQLTPGTQVAPCQPGPGVVAGPQLAPCQQHTPHQQQMPSRQQIPCQHMLLEQMLLQQMLLQQMLLRQMLLQQMMADHQTMGNMQ